MANMYIFKHMRNAYDNCNENNKIQLFPYTKRKAYWREIKVWERNHFPKRELLNGYVLFLVDCLISSGVSPIKF